MSAFDHPQFTELLISSPQQAFEYRLRTSGLEIPEYYGDIKLDTSSNPKEEVIEKKEEIIIETPQISIETTEEEPKTSLDSADLRKLLQDNNIKYSNASTIEKLMEKCIENNLL